MTVTATVELDPFLLLAGGTGRLTAHPFDETKLVDQINTALAARAADHPLEYLEMIPPNVTGRWGLRWADSFDPDKSFEYRAKRGQTPGQIRDWLPDAVVRLLRQLAGLTLVLEQPT